MENRAEGAIRRWACCGLAGLAVAAALLLPSASWGDPPRARGDEGEDADKDEGPGKRKEAEPTLSVQALLYHDGSTRIGLAVSDPDEPGPPPPGDNNITEVGLRLPSGRHEHSHLQLEYEHLGGGSSLTLTLPDPTRPQRRYQVHLSHDEALEVRASVRDVDRRRGRGHEEETRAQAQVLFAPDLQVGAVQAPAQAAVAAAVSIAAAVSEANGDVGARADCNLYVDGTLAGSQPNLAIAAGGSATCAFTHTFAAAGSHVLTVKVENVSPPDFGGANDTNNAASTTIQIVTPLGGFEGTAASLAALLASGWTNPNRLTSISYIQGRATITLQLPPSGANYWELNAPTNALPAPPHPVEISLKGGFPALDNWGAIILNAGTSSWALTAVFTNTSGDPSYPTAGITFQGASTGFFTVPLHDTRAHIVMMKNDGIVDATGTTTVHCYVDNVLVFSPKFIQFRPPPFPRLPFSLWVLDRANAATAAFVDYLVWTHP